MNGEVSFDEIPPIIPVVDSNVSVEASDQGSGMDMPDDQDLYYFEPFFVLQIQNLSISTSSRKPHVSTVQFDRPASPEKFYQQSKRQTHIARKRNLGLTGDHLREFLNTAFHTVLMILFPTSSLSERQIVQPRPESCLGATGI